MIEVQVEGKLGKVFEQFDEWYEYELFNLALVIWFCLSNLNLFESFDKMISMMEVQVERNKVIIRVYLMSDPCVNRLTLCK
jgi:hypothetical protein